MRKGESEIPEIHLLFTATRLKHWLTRCLLGGLLMSVALGHAQTAAEAWVRRYSNQKIGGADDYAYKIAVDAEGNAIVAGYTDNGNGADMVTIKYSSAGTPLWTNRFDGVASAADRAGALAVDTAGNIFVTGSSVLSEFYGDSECVTIAYSGAGVPLWTNRYSGSGFDGTTAIAVDSSGDVVVTGTSNNGGASADYLTIKYTGGGVPIWTNRYKGPGDNMYSATAIAIDGTGNVFVTGSASATIAYSGAGVPLWTNRYNGAGYNHALALDSQGNVFVTSAAIGAGFTTIAYSGTGVPFWTNGYAGPADDESSSIAVDSSGSVFVTGYSLNLNGFSYVTIKYSGSGMPLWTNRYSGPAVNDEARATAMVVDASGNVFVTGYSVGIGRYYDYATIAYSGSGVPFWTNRYDGPINQADNPTSIAVDSSGNVLVTGNSARSGKDYDFATVKYSASGVPLWTNRYDGPHKDEARATAIAVHSAGNVFVTGRSTGSGSFADYTTIGYSRSGVPLWTNRYDGPSNRDDLATAIAVDSVANVFVTGVSYSGGNDYHYATIAYSSVGAALWTNRYSRMEGSANQPTAIAVDRDGNVFVTGYSAASNLVYYSDYVTVKYSGSGVPLWTNRYNGPANSDDETTAVAVDASGNVFVTGYSLGGSGTYSEADYATIAYSGAGVPLWTNRYNGPDNYRDTATAIAVDSNGNVFVTGNSINRSYSYSDYITIKYSPAGVPAWTNRYDGPINRDDQATAIAVDKGGNVLVTGYSAGSSAVYQYDYATLKYSGAGALLWTRRYNGPANGDDRAGAIAVDADGNIFVTGYSVGSGGYHDYVTIAYSGSGMPLWTNRYNGPANRDDDPGTKCLAVGPGGAVYVTGTSVSYQYGNVYDYATVKYLPLPKLAIQSLPVGKSEVNLTLTGAPDSDWFIERALRIGGPWTNLGPVTIPSTRSAPFQDTIPTVSGAFYRARSP